MQGYQLTFLTQQNRSHDHQPLAEWLLQAAKRLGIRGATLIAAAEGLGHDQRIHSARFFDLADQPQEILMVVSEAEADALFALIAQEKVKVFYVKTPVEFGTTGE